MAVTWNPTNVRTPAEYVPLFISVNTTDQPQLFPLQVHQFSNDTIITRVAVPPDGRWRWPGDPTRPMDLGTLQLRISGRSVYEAPILALMDSWAAAMTLDVYHSLAAAATLATPGTEGAASVAAKMAEFGTLFRTSATALGVADGLSIKVWRNDNVQLRAYGVDGGVTVYLMGTQRQDIR